MSLLDRLIFTLAPFSHSWIMTPVEGCHPSELRTSWSPSAEGPLGVDVG